jgi:transcriptional regulator with XRE-family HTH domain
MILNMNTSASVDSLSALGQLMRAARKRQRLDQEELAAATGVARRVVINAELGRSITTANLLKLLQGLSLDFSLGPRRLTGPFGEGSDRADG